MTDQPLGAIFATNYVIRCGYCQHTEVLDGANSMQGAIQIARERRWHTSKAYKWICHTCRYSRPAHGSNKNAEEYRTRLMLAKRPQLIRVASSEAAE